MTLADTPESVTGGVWLEGDIIVFSTLRGLYRLSSLGGTPAKIDGQDARRLAWLPGRRFLFTRPDGIFAGSVDGGRPVRILPDRVLYAAYVPPAKPARVGHLLYLQGGVQQQGGAATVQAASSLAAQAFDAESLNLQGQAIPLATPSKITWWQRALMA